MDRIARVFEQYDRQGIHRTGTDVDERSARWLAGEVEAAGLEPSLVPVPLERLDPLEAALHLGDRTFEGLPLFDGSYTGAEGVRGTLGPLGSAADIGVGTFVFGGPGAQRLARARGGGKQRALVVVCDGPSLGLPPGLTPLNADRFVDPFGPPVLQVSSEAGPLLAEAAAAGTDARLVCRVERTPVQALNVEATIAGTAPELDPLVVMTPRSGWWRCASERGGGLVCWLEIMRALSESRPRGGVRESRPRRGVRFLASTGHELGHLGLESFLGRNVELVKGALAWIHLGANFAAAVRGSVRLQSSDAELRQLALSALQRASAAPDGETPPGAHPGGEARNIHDGGGRYVSLIGGNGLFHHPDDRWPQAVDLEKTARIAGALAELAVRLAA